MAANRKDNFSEEVRGELESAPLIHGWTRVDVQNGAGRPYRNFVKALNDSVVDEDGTVFLDARSMIWNVSFGHGRREILEAVTAQLSLLATVPTIHGLCTEAAETLAHRLTQMTGLERVYLSLSGSSANEVAITLARNHFVAKGEPDRRIIVTLDRGYHGQSIGTLALAGYDEYPKFVDALPLGYARVMNCYCYRCPVGRQRDTCHIECADALIHQIEALGSERIAALMIEPVQGSVGHVPPQEWFTKITSFLTAKGILLLVDEVANGFARLGANFGFQAFDLRPDIVTLSKAITNGVLPLAATLVTREVMAPLIDIRWAPFFGSTQDGNPVCAAAALGALDVFESEDWSARARALGAILHDALVHELGEHPNVGEIRGTGLFRAVELVEDRVSRAAFCRLDQLNEAIYEQHLLVQGEGSRFIFAPPLTTEEETIKEIARRFGAALRMVSPD